MERGKVGVFVGMMEEDARLALYYGEDEAIIDFLFGFFRALSESAQAEISQEISRMGYRPGQSDLSAWRRGLPISGYCA
jgi:hypothetical protein